MEVAANPHGTMVVAANPHDRMVVAANRHGTIEICRTFAILTFRTNCEDDRGHGGQPITKDWKGQERTKNPGGRRDVVHGANGRCLAE